MAQPRCTRLPARRQCRPRTGSAGAAPAATGRWEAAPRAASRPLGPSLWAPDLPGHPRPSPGSTLDSSSSKGARVTHLNVLSSRNVCAPRPAPAGPGPASPPAPVPASARGAPPPRASQQSISAPMSTACRPRPSFSSSANSLVASTRMTGAGAARARACVRASRGCLSVRACVRACSCHVGVCMRAAALTFALPQGRCTQRLKLVAVVIELVRVCKRLRSCAQRRRHEGVRVRASNAAPGAAGCAVHARQPGHASNAAGRQRGRQATRQARSAAGTQRGCG